MTKNRSYHPHPWVVLVIWRFELIGSQVVHIIHNPFVVHNIQSLELTDRKNLNLSISLDQVRNIHNYPRLFLNSMHTEKKEKNILRLYKDLESANKNHSSNSDVPVWNPHGEDDDRNRKSLVNPKSFTRSLKPWSWHTFGEKEKRVEAMDLHFSRWWKTKSIKTLSFRGYL